MDLPSPMVALPLTVLVAVCLADSSLLATPAAT